MSPEPRRKVSGNVFNAGQILYRGDVIFELAGRQIEIPHFHFMDFAIQLFSAAFGTAFTADNYFQYRGIDNPVFFTAHDQEGLTQVQLAAALVGVFYVDGVALNPTEGKAAKAEIQVPVHVYTRLCGEIFRAALDALDEKFEGVDGVREYFSSLPFAQNYSSIYEDEE
jgi:hypothetical protein